MLFSPGLGFLNGITYCIPMEHGWRWFPDRPGLISGLILGGFGLGAFSFNFLCAGIVNPDNERPFNGKFSDEVNGRVQKMLFIFCGTAIAMAVIGALLMFPGKDFVNKKEVKERV